MKKIIKMVPVPKLKKLSLGTGSEYKKNAFTLVELIVVITILAILATIWFIAFWWNSYKAKKVTLQSNVKNIDKIIATKLASWKNINDFMSGSLITDNWVNTWSTVTVGSGAYILADLKYKVWELNFFKLKMKWDDFKNEKKQKYLFWYIKTPDKLYYQIASEIKNESWKNEIILYWRYSQIATTDARWLISEKWFDIWLENWDSLTGSLY